MVVNTTKNIKCFLCVEAGTGGIITYTQIGHSER